MNIPMMPFKFFSKEVFQQVIEIYASSAKIKDPCGKRIDPDREYLDVVKEIHDDHSYCEWRLGSFLTHHSKLFLHAITHKPDGLYIGFDLDPNTADDDEPQCHLMRETFHGEVRKYIESILEAERKKLN